MGTEGFTFEIVGSADKANKSIDETLNKLDRIAPAAYKAGSGIETASQRAAALVAKLSAEQDRASAAQDRHNAALQRQQQVLESIRGPLQENSDHMQALQALYGQGAITAHQYTTEVTKLRDAMMAQNSVHLQAPSAGGGFNVGSALGGLPGGSIIAGAAGGGVAGAAQAGVQAAVGATSQIIEMSDAYTGLMNRLVAMTGSQERANALFEQLHQSADRTRSDLNATAGAYVTFNRALQGLHVSQSQVLAFTEHLNEAITLGGTDAVGATNAMTQLSQALASGTLRGQDFNSIISQAPTLLEPIAQHLHTTVGALRQMAEEGKITAQVIFDSYEGQGGAGPRLQRAFADAVPTISGQFQVLKNDALAAVGKFMADADAAEIVAAAMDKAKTAIAAAAGQLKFWINLYKEGKEYGLDAKFLISGGAEDFKEFADATGFVNTVLGREVDLQKQLKIALLEGVRSTHDAANAQRAYNDSLREGLHGVSSLASTLTSTLASKGFYAFVTDPWFVAPETPAKIARVSHQLDILADIRRRLAVEKAHAELQPEYGDNLIFKKAESHEYKDSNDVDKKILEQIKKREDAERKADADAAKAADDLAKKQAEAAARAHEAWANTATDMITSLASGEKSWEAWGQSAVAAIERAIIKMLILKAIQVATGDPGGIAGGGGLADQVVGKIFGVGGGDVPGHATGTQFMVGGRSGTDQNYVAFRASNDERVTVETAADIRNGKYFGGGGGNVTITPVINVLQAPERRDIVDTSRNGLTNFVQLQRQMPNRRR